MKSAVVVFAKTPGLSPIKTRLAISTGAQFANDFYIKCIDVLDESLRRLTEDKVELIWSVAEKSASEHLFWRGKNLVYQGEGGLGERLHSTFAQVKPDFDAICLLGSDMPQISTAIIKESLTDSYKHNEFIIGPCVDGGYYLFTSCLEVPQYAWLGVRYSTEYTLIDFRSQLNSLGPVSIVKEEFDIDTLEDLNLFAKLELSSASPKLLDLQDFAKDFLARRSSPI